MLYLSIWFAFLRVESSLAIQDFSEFFCLPRRLPERTWPILISFAEMQIIFKQNVPVLPKNINWVRPRRWSSGTIGCVLRGPDGHSMNMRLIVNHTTRMQANSRHRMFTNHKCREDDQRWEEEGSGSHRLKQLHNCELWCTWWDHSGCLYRLFDGGAINISLRLLMWRAACLGGRK